MVFVKLFYAKVWPLVYVQKLRGSNLLPLKKQTTLSWCYDYKCRVDYERKHKHLFIKWKNLDNFSKHSHLIISQRNKIHKETLVRCICKVVVCGLNCISVYVNLIGNIVIDTMTGPIIYIICFAIACNSVFPSFKPSWF